VDEISKTKRKKAMLALQDLGEELVALNHEQLVQLALPERLREAIVEAKGMSKFGARKRQLQFIGRLMREADAQPIRDKLESLRGRSREHAAWLHKVERWRDRLLSDEASLAELAAQHPEADTGRLRELIRHTRTDTTLAKRSYRELFQELRKIFPEI
jgi:ribosome-associated protein